MATILLVDDDPASLEVMMMALQQQGHEVICAENGQEAYETTVSERPDLVFLDIMMPDGDGFETCQRIRQNPEVPSTLPVVFLTSAQVDKERLANSGASDHLPKRHMVGELREMLDKHLKSDPGVDL